MKYTIHEENKFRRLTTTLLVADKVTGPMTEFLCHMSNLAEPDNPDFLNWIPFL
jgi:hypothetical protein